MGLARPHQTISSLGLNNGVRIELYNPLEFHVGILQRARGRSGRWIKSWSDGTSITGGWSPSVTLCYGFARGWESGSLGATKPCGEFRQARGLVPFYLLCCQGGRKNEPSFPKWAG